MKRMLQYLDWLGDSAKTKGGAIWLYAKMVTSACDAAIADIDSLKNQIYLKSARGEYLDRWGEDLVQLKRKYNENDESYRARILLEMFREYASRKAIIDIVKDITGFPPIEVFEPVRDTAYWGSGVFAVPKSRDMSAADDGTGTYCARLGSRQDTSYTGYVRVRLTENVRASIGLYFYDVDYADAETMMLPGKRSINISRDEFMQAIRKIIPAGTQVFVQFVD
ncbi:hypothetical protein [uncultured Phascolarctobacterium sp.]|uniref:hypothetical protein n=1 Tax=uncultured Phascolarctobacterium sp. TaxID=512296 RepID=UPI002614FD7B|nr:hypothetical protein [uncultured Phascolarctobacterium sp.]